MKRVIIITILISVFAVVIPITIKPSSIPLKLDKLDINDGNVKDTTPFPWKQDIKLRKHDLQENGLDAIKPSPIPLKLDILEIKDGSAKVTTPFPWKQDIKLRKEDLGKSGLQAAKTSPLPWEADNNKKDVGGITPFPWKLDVKERVQKIEERGLGDFINFMKAVEKLLLSIVGILDGSASLETLIGNVQKVFFTFETLIDLRGLAYKVPFIGGFLGPLVGAIFTIIKDASMLGGIVEEAFGGGSRR